MRQILTIETTCDETATAIIDENLRVLGSVVASQAKLHEKYHGVVPEIAARAHLERIIPALHQTLVESDLQLRDLSAIAVATAPGLANSLLVGLTAAKTLAMVLGIPLIATDHLLAHVYACRMAAGRDIYPCVGLIISGGHTHLYRFETAIDAALLGGTIDDAAGEAFDKVATLLGLGYPGGPALSKLAETGDPAAIHFPRSFIHETRLDFSFSGLKTAVRYALFPQGTSPKSIDSIPAQRIADIAASFEQAVAEAISIKAVQATQYCHMRRLCVGGGVAANRVVRRELSLRTEAAGIDLLVAPLDLCTDNAVMGGIAWEKFHRSEFAELDIDILPGLVRSRPAVHD